MKKCNEKITVKTYVMAPILSSQEFTKVLK